MFQTRPEHRTLPTAQPTPPDDPFEEIALYRRMCRELAELGMELARTAARQALEQTPPAEPDAAPMPRQADPRLVFTHLARSVRQCIALGTRLAAATGADAKREAQLAANRIAIAAAALRPLNPEEAALRELVQPAFRPAPPKPPEPPPESLFSSICDSLNRPAAAHHPPT